MGALLALNYVGLATLTGLGLALLPAKIATEVALVVVSYQAQRRLVVARRPSVTDGREVAAAGAPALR